MGYEKPLKLLQTQINIAIGKKFNIMFLVIDNDVTFKL